MNDMQEILFNAAILAPSILIGVSVHESAHALAAFWLGDDTAKREGRITLNPIKHITWITLVFAAVALIPGSGMFIPFKPVPINHEKLKDPRWGAGLTAIAGPLSNLLLAFTVILIVKVLFVLFGTDALLSTDASGWIFEGILFFCLIQISLFVFNMLPIPPLDGHWVLGALVPPLDRAFQVLRERMLGFLILLIAINLPPVRDALSFFSRASINMILGIWGLK